MARNPTPSTLGSVVRDLQIGTPVTPDRFKEFKPQDGPAKPAEDLRLSEYIAAVRREVESVNFIAASSDPNVPKFMVSDVELELVCAISEISDDGLRVTVDAAKLAATPEAMLQKVKLRLTDPDVLNLQLAVRDKA